MVISWVCRLIITLYLLDTRETSFLILFEICLDLFLSTWKLTKAIKIQCGFENVVFKTDEKKDGSGELELTSLK